MERFLQLFARLVDFTYTIYTGSLLADWTTRDIHRRLLARYHLSEGDYTLGQLCYDLRKLRAHGLAERIGRPRRYRFTAVGIRIGVLLVKASTRLLGPLLAKPRTPRSQRSANPSKVEAPLRDVDTALDVLCDQLGIRAAV